MFALKLFPHPKPPLSVTGMNVTVYPTKLCLPFLYGWGEICGAGAGCWGCIRGLCGVCKGCVGMCSTWGTPVRGECVWCAYM